MNTKSCITRTDFCTVWRPIYSNVCVKVPDLFSHRFLNMVMRTFFRFHRFFLCTDCEKTDAADHVWVCCNKSHSLGPGNHIVHQCRLEHSSHSNICCIITHRHVFFNSAFQIINSLPIKFSNSLRFTSFFVPKYRTNRTNKQYGGSQHLTGFCSLAS